MLNPLCHHHHNLLVLLLLLLFLLLFLLFQLATVRQMALPCSYTFPGSISETKLLHTLLDDSKGKGRRAKEGGRSNDKVSNCDARRECSVVSPVVM